MDVECRHCGALPWRAEMRRGGFEPCWKNGRVRLSQFQEPPEPLRSLLDRHRTDLSAEDAEAAKEFRRNIRRYNCAIAFTSFNAETDFDDDDDARSNRQNHFAFQIHGHAYSLLGPEEPGTTSRSTRRSIFTALRMQPPSATATILIWTWLCWSVWRG
ncbi:hypothetical protein VTN31DRAFT_1334 [Thermomyces dupontii]|uniref:uncharacterized protein n=1 Tax=Talaromyces thermophilus TaxID=28565 RepID=UPI003744842E